MNEDKRIAAPSSNDELSIDLYSIFLDVSKEWLSILLLTVSVVLISYVVLTNFRALNYSTSATMVINNDDGSDGVKTSSTPEVYENIYNGADSASRITGIFESKALKETVAKELGLKSFSGTISAKTLGESNLLKITVRSVSPYISYREAESVLKNYEKFSKDLVGGTELTVLERPKVPERVEHPLQNLQYSVYAGILTFVAVCAILALLSALRDTVHNSSEVEKKLDTKLLATIMHETKHRKGKKRIGGEKTSILISDPVTSFQYAEDMRKLAARVLNEMTEHNQKVLMISSVAENEGKSTVSANLALAMAQISKKVVLIDMDFRKPSLYKILNLQDGDFHEFSEYLKEIKTDDQADYEGAVNTLLYKVPGSELATVLNRKSIPQAVEKHSNFIKGVVDALGHYADYVIVDTAPTSLVSDAEELAGMADTSLLVVRQHWTEARDINDTIDALGGKERVIGCVFNNVHKTGLGGNTGYGYGYGYSHGYGYGGHYAK